MQPLAPSLAARSAVVPQGVRMDTDLGVGIGVGNGVGSGEAQSGACTSHLEQAWAVLDTVLDPEVPALSLCDLGVVREVIPSLEAAGGLEVVLTPTYSGCPATEVIAASVQQALQEAGLGPVQVTYRLAPAWTTDWISERGSSATAAAGGAGGCAVGASAASARVSPIRLRLHKLACPRCASTETEQLAAFGSTACKALHRCLACREPFEYFKPI
jgi:ring-1,2-phenylacetyl-CoA epoxidase subunit PaaD